MDILKESLALSAYTTAIRRQLHEHPELSGREFGTVRLICAELDQMGIEYVNIPHIPHINFARRKRRGRGCGGCRGAGRGLPDDVRHCA